MIAGRNRFHGLGSVQSVYRRGVTLRGAMINLKVAQTRSGPTNGIDIRTKVPYKAAVVVSKKVHKSAVVRNRIRRRMYELVRTYPDLPRLAGLQLVFVVYNEQLATIEGQKLKANVYDLLARANATTNSSTNAGAPASPNSGERAIVEPKEEP